MKPYQALIWNEWRQMRGNVMALAGVTVLLWLLMLLGCNDKTFVEYIEMGALALVIGLPLLYSAVLADSFAREFGQKTDSFLLELPVSSTKIFFCKYFANLAAYLVLVLLEVLLMSRFCFRVKHIDSMMVIVFIIFTTAWILVHAIVFLSSLIGKKAGNGIVAIIILPLPYLLLFSGTMTVTMFFINDNYNWIIFSHLFSLFLLCGFCVWFGWYLWSCRIVRGKRVLKPVIVALSYMLIVPWILYGFVYFYFSFSFNSAIREARTAGLELDIKKVVLPPVPAEQNAVLEILNFYHEYQPIYKHYSKKYPESGETTPGTFPSQLLLDSLWTGTDFIFNGIPGKIIQPKNIYEITDIIMNDPRINKCYITLSGALKKPYCRFDTDYVSAQYCGLISSVLDIISRASLAVNFLSDRAYALRVVGRNDDFFVCLVSIDRIADALTEQPSAYLKMTGLGFKAIEYQTAIAAGPDTFEAIKFYNKMIRDADSINPTMPDETFMIHNYLKNISSLIPPAIDDGFLLKSKLLFPRHLQSAAAWLRWKIEQDKLLKQASASASIKAIEPAANSLQKIRNAIPGFLKLMVTNDLFYNFMWRERFESYKLCLALKIYYIKHGKFPESLQQLVPEILPSVPINPLTGKDYTYQPEASGFLLSDYSSRNQPNQKILSGIRYQTWDIKPEKAK